MSTLRLVRSTQVSPAVEVVEIAVGASSQFEVRCSLCPVVGIWEYERHALNEARLHVCKSDVAARLGAAWRRAVDVHPFVPGPAQASLFAETCAILDDYGVPRTREHLRKLNWLCGFEDFTVAAFVDLMVVGRVLT